MDKKIINKIKDPMDKFTLLLLLNHPIIEADYTTIKINNINENRDNYIFGDKLFFNKLHKGKRMLYPIKLMKSEVNLLNKVLKTHQGNYLFNYTEKSFYNYIRKITKKYIGKSLSFSQLRKLKEDSITDIKINEWMDDIPINQIFLDFKL